MTQNFETQANNQFFSFYIFKTAFLKDLKSYFINSIKNKHKKIYYQNFKTGIKL